MLDKAMRLREVVAQVLDERDLSGRVEPV